MFAHFGYVIIKLGDKFGNLMSFKFATISIERFINKIVSKWKIYL